LDARETKLVPYFVRLTPFFSPSHFRSLRKNLSPIKSESRQSSYWVSSLFNAPVSGFMVADRRRSAGPDTVLIVEIGLLRTPFYTSNRIRSTTSAVNVYFRS